MVASMNTSNVAKILGLSVGLSLVAAIVLLLMFVFAPRTTSVYIETHSKQDVKNLKKRNEDLGYATLALFCYSGIAGGVVIALRRSMI